MIKDLNIKPETIKSIEENTYVLCMQGLTGFWPEQKCIVIYWDRVAWGRRNLQGNKIQ